MAEELTRLTSEIERVVTAPYVPSLQNLHYLVQASSSSIVDSWVLHKPCQVGLLADVLVEGLSRSRYHPACVALFSSPLPRGFTPPARLAGFITKLVSMMAANPGAETIAPLHALMTGLQGSPNFINDVPIEVMSNLQLEFTKMLRNLDDHMGNLLGLATFAQIASTQQKQPRNQHGPEMPSWLLNIQNFFGPKRGLKTLDLIVLRVILACSSSCNNLTPSQAAESIRLAICIADVIEPEQKRIWLTSNSAKIAKLCEKVARENLNRETQIMGVTFLLSLQTVGSLPSHIRDLGLRVLVSKDSRVVLGAMPTRLVSRLTDSLVGYDESVIYELLRFTVEALKEDSLGRDSMVNLHVSNLLFSEFQSNLSQPMIASLLNSASTKRTIASLFGNFPLVPGQQQCQGSQVCYCAYSALQNSILLKLFDIYFAAALSHGDDSTDIVIMRTFVERATRTINSSECSFTQAACKDFRGCLDLRNRQEFALTGRSTLDWRSAITKMHRQDSEISHSNMMKRIEDICFDLERRCYDIEGPVRSAEEERDRQTNEAEQLRQKNEDLHRQLDQSLDANSSLQQELARLEAHADNANTRVEELSAALESTRQELHDQQHHSEEVLRMEQEKARTRELDLIATSTEKDDQLEELQEQVRHLKSDSEGRRQVMETLTHDKSASAKTMAALQHEIEEVKGFLEANQLLCSQKEDEIKRLLTDNKDLQIELSSMKTMLWILFPNDHSPNVQIEEQNLQVERLYSKLQEAEEKARTDTEMLKQEQEAKIASFASKVAKQQEESARIQKVMQTAANDAFKKLQSKDKRIHQLESKIQSLRDARTAKAREFSEAQQHISRLINVMGFSAKPNEQVPNRPQPSRDTDTVLTSDQRHSAAWDGDDDIQLAESLGSLSSHLQGPSPRRPEDNGRYIHLSPAPAPKTPTGVGSTVNITVPRTISRQPLVEADLNSPLKPQLSVGPKGSQYRSASTEVLDDNHFHDLDLDMDLEFSKDHIFTSTAFSGPSDLLAPQ
ncbi:uncharacterized protein N7482_009734 [Penicillium canariense]|uniref:Uncharacterized protein n=1 Tax=Penicillium canariense TaxID=189055 RepID=A0A9W9HRV7_9EURO|nr:uncharacterized protein N7482_009734 [Penicillium canariense]KAJ5153256.1 hypothetical protein N7482_009734 [Penicillium canariense]